MEASDARAAPDAAGDYLDAPAAAALLGVKLATLYAYASRGLLASAPGPEGRSRRYARAELERLRARRDARAGHGPVAAGALRWGEPVLPSAITSVADGALRYRGHSAVQLATDDVPFESVAELLFEGNLPARASAEAWSAPGLGVRATVLTGLLAGERDVLAGIALLVPALAVRDAERFATRADAVLPRARVLIARMAAALGLADATGKRLARALALQGVARIAAAALGARGGDAGVRALNRALVLCADHELNASTFAARVVASTGADLYACVAGALAALSGPTHGGASRRVEALLGEVGRAERAAAVLSDRARRGEATPGFGHPLYPAGDPRATVMLDDARKLAGTQREVRVALAVIDAMAKSGNEAPNLDIALVALASALGLPPGSAAGIFALGRAAGWTAHVLEQYRAGFLVRPRAQYTGP